MWNKYFEKHFLTCYWMLVDNAEELFGTKTLICSEDVLFCLVSHFPILLFQVFILQTWIQHSTNNVLIFWPLNIIFFGKTLCSKRDYCKISLCYLLNQTENTRFWRIRTFPSFCLNNVNAFQFQILCKLDLLVIQMLRLNQTYGGDMEHLFSRSAACNLVG